MQMGNGITTPLCRASRGNAEFDDAVVFGQHGHSLIGPALAAVLHGGLHFSPSPRDTANSMMAMTNGPRLVRLDLNITGRDRSQIAIPCVESGRTLHGAATAGIYPNRLEQRGIGIHSLRKTAINDAIRNGAPMHEVREFSGQSDIRITTELYFVRKEENGEVAARRIQVRARQKKNG
jgi:integrase